MIKTGIYGGSFNPIHNGHIALAHRFLEALGLDEVWFVVSPQNPFKVNDSLLDDNKRLELTRKAIEDEPHIHVCDIEFHLSKPSYMWNTLQTLSAQHPDREFTLLIGGDNWTHFAGWYHADDILATYPIAIYPRKGQAISKETLPATVSLVEGELLDISSTDIRNRIDADKDINGMVPQSIEKDVKRLYGRKDKTIISAIADMILAPILRNKLFFFFMYLLGIVSSYLVVPKVRNAHVYDNLWLELFFDLYIICIPLAILPFRIRRWVRGIVAAIAYIVTIIDTFCFVKFQATLNPTMLLLVGETDSREASEFFSSYFTTDIIFSGVGIIVLIMLAHISIALTPRKRLREKTKKIRTFFTKRSGWRWVFTPVIVALFVWSAISSWHNKQEMVEMFGKQTIGQVEHELTTKDCARFYLPCYRLWFSIFSNKLASQQIDKLIAAKDKVTVDSCSFRSPDIVLIIGESYNKHHSQLYGYDKKTTPRQARRAKRDRLVVFTDVVAPWNLTSFVFKNVFSMHVVGQEGDWCDYPLFPEIFRKAGYHVSFITNQFLPKAKEAVYDFSGGFFLNNPVLDKAQFDTRNTRVHRLDEGILKDYDEMDDDKERGEDKKGRLTIFHVMGQHVNYHQRYPKKQRKWYQEDYDRPDLTKKQRDIISHYDNATLYNDSIVDEIMRRYEDKNAIVIYMPDHGEECYNDGFKHHGRNHSAVIDKFLAHQEFDVPFWIWCSHKYAVEHPDIYRAIIEAKDRRMMTDALPHLLLYLAGISSKDYHAEYNILSPEYDEMRPRIIKGTTDYDEVIRR